MDADVIVIGGGPAGVACAIFTARFGLSTAIVEHMGLGGQLVNVHLVRDYPGFPEGIAGWDLAAALSEQVQACGVEVALGSAERLARSGDRWVVAVGGETHRARAVVVATGCSPIPLPGKGTAQFAGRGVSYCASCDGEFFRGQPVAVVGGGDTGLSEAAFLADVASHVAVLFQESVPPAAAAWQAEVRAHPNVRFMPSTRVIEVLGGDQGVTTLRYVTLADGAEHELAVSGVFGAVGMRPNSEPFRTVLDTDGAGFITTDETMACTAQGIFAAGDVRAGGSMQAAGAVGEGVRAALSVRRFLGTTT
jgi:thioredoxin reductase (NADPH)